MRAVMIREPGDEDVLSLVERPEPEPPAGHVRVRVHLAGVNRADLLQRAGRYPAPPGVPSDVPGLEYCGVIDALGPDANRWRVGDRVLGLVAGGAYAEHVVVHEREAVRLPDAIDDETAAALPEAFVTAYDALVVRGGLRPGERVLVHAVGSGVGTAALQIARALGCFTTGTSRTVGKLDRARELGLDAAVLVSSDTSLRDALAREGRAHDVVLDLVGGPYFAQSIDSVAERGRIVVVGLTGGARTELDLGALLRKRLSVVGTVLRSRPLEEKIEAAQLLERTIVPWVSKGLVRPVIDAVLPLAQAAEAHRRLAANATFGKVLLDLRPSPT